MVLLPYIEEQRDASKPMPLPPSRVPAPPEAQKSAPVPDGLPFAVLPEKVPVIFGKPANRTERGVVCPQATRSRKSGTVLYPRAYSSGWPEGRAKMIARRQDSSYNTLARLPFHHALGTAQADKEGVRHADYFCPACRLGLRPFYSALCALKS